MDLGLWQKELSASGLSFCTFIGLFLHHSSGGSKNSKQLTKEPNMIYVNTFVPDTKANPAELHILREQHIFVNAGSPVSFNETPF